jgi:nucleotide-binding universal stress UspA family protein
MRHILFPIDFSARCDAMAPVVAAWARAFHADLTLLHVMETARLASSFAALEDHFGTVREELQGHLERFQVAAFAGISVDRVFKLGHAVDEITRYAEIVEADLIAMPTHGRSRFRALLLGSVTAGVLHDSPAAILTSAHSQEAPLSAIPRSVVCAIDLSAYSAEVLRMASHVAETCSAALHIVHVLPDIAAAKAQATYEDLAFAAEIDSPLQTLQPGPLTETVIDAATRHNADLLVIGRGKLTGVLGRLRTHAHDLIRRSPCPVLSV